MFTRGLVMLGTAPGRSSECRRWACAFRSTVSAASENTAQIAIPVWAFGFGAHSNAPRLKHTGSCMGGEAGQVSCAPGHEGPMCTVCSEANHYVKNEKGVCKECPSGHSPNPHTCYE